MKKVLIIEDERMHSELASVYLKRAGYSVLMANNAETGIQLANEESPDLILMDISLPDMNGFQVAHMLKEEEQTQDIKIIAFTVFSEEETGSHVLSACCEDIITKPIQPKPFIDRINAALA